MNYSGTALNERTQRVASSALLWIVLGLLVIVPVVTFLLTAFSPRMFHLGPQWISFHSFREAFQGSTGQGIADSLWVSSAVGLCASAAATALAWLVQRTNMRGSRFISGLMWVQLLIPTWMMTIGWTNLIMPGEVASAFGFNTTRLYHLFYGPVGIMLILTTAALPFCYFVVSAGLRGLGSEFEDAVRVHGGSTVRVLRTVLPIIAPAIMSAFVIAFAESISDFGVAFTLGLNDHFPMATFTLFNAITQNPANFSVAAVIAGVLILCTVPPIFLQSKITRGRSYAVLGGRARPIRRHQFSGVTRNLVTFAVFSVLIALIIIPLVASLATSFTHTISFETVTGVHWSLASYRQVFSPPPSIMSMGAGLALSNHLGLYVATGTVILSYVLATRLARTSGGLSQRITDVFLLGSIAIPGVVLGVGYILFYNQGFIANHVMSLYHTMPLLALGLMASAVPGQSRLLVGPVSQLQSSMIDAARVHGAARFRAWCSTALPILSRTLTWAWVLTFTKTISELAVAQMLVVPDHEPISVILETTLGTVFAPIGVAATVLVLGEMLGIIGLVLLAYRVVAPRGWRRIGTIGELS